MEEDKKDGKGKYISIKQTNFLLHNMGHLPKKNILSCVVYKETKHTQTNHIHKWILDSSVFLFIYLFIFNRHYPTWPHVQNTIFVTLQLPMQCLLQSKKVPMQKCCNQYSFDICNVFVFVFFYKFKLSAPNIHTFLFLILLENQKTKQ